MGFFDQINPQQQIPGSGGSLMMEQQPLTLLNPSPPPTARPVDPRFMNPQANFPQINNGPPTFNGNPMSLQALLGQPSQSQNTLMPFLQSLFRNSPMLDSRHLGSMPTSAFAIPPLGFNGAM